LKVLLSTILTVPPGFCIAGTSENLNVYGIGVSFGITMSSLRSSGGGIAVKKTASGKGVQRGNENANKGRYKAHVLEFDQKPANHRLGRNSLR
jgi:hypothetical protein